MYHDILVATDGSSLGQQAAEHALGLAKPLGATVHAVAILSEAVFTRDRIRADPKAELTDALELIKRTADETGVAVTTSMSEGDPCEEIVRHADDRSVDLIIMGTTVGGPVSRIVHGSTTMCVSKRADVPVMTVGEQTRPLLDVHEEATFQFRCDECETTLKVDEKTRGALEESGCIICGAGASPGAFRLLEGGGS